MIEDSFCNVFTETKEEAEIRDLWQCFFENIAIKERLNLVLQQKFLPRRIWHDLVEKVGDTSGHFGKKSSI